MQPAGRQFRSDPRDTDPVIVRSALGSSMVFTPQMSSQRPNSSKIMISTGKPVSIGQGQNLIYSNQRFPSPSMFTPKQAESGSAFTTPRQSAFTATGTSRRGITVKEEPHDKNDRARMVWHPGSANDQAYRMSIANSTLGNGSSSIMIPAVLHGQPSIYLDQTLASQLALHQYHPVSTTGHNVVPMIMSSRHGEAPPGTMAYLPSGINQGQPRPSILRKRMQPEVQKNAMHDDVKHMGDNGQSSSYFHGDPSVYSIRGKMGQEIKGSGVNHRGKPPPNDPYQFLDSPRKKPRKQNVVVNEDVFASNVPQDNKSDQLQWQNSHIKCEPKNDVQSNQIHYFERKRMSILSGYKCNNRAVYNHFERHTDIRVKKKKKKCGSELVPASTINSQGWRLMHIVSQLDDILSIQKDTKAKLCEYKDYFSNLSINNHDNDNEESVADILQNNNHCCQSNITQTKQVMTSVDRLLNDHKPKILELMKDVNSKNVLKVTPPHTTPQRLKSDTQSSSSAKKGSRKRKT